jgi:peptidyl-prolyl cis-trans isomerase C
MTFDLQAIRGQLLARAAALGIAADFEEAQIDALLDREVHVEPPTDAECRAYYAEHPQAFRAGTLIEADHILFAAREDSHRPGLRECAQEKLALLLRGEIDFAKAAMQWSNCPSGALGGNLGQLTREQVVPEFWQALEEFGASGILPEPVETRFGLHIVRVSRRVPGEPLPYEFVADRVAMHLADHRLRVALRNYAHALLHETLGDESHAH